MNSPPRSIDPVLLYLHRVVLLRLSRLRAAIHAYQSSMDQKYRDVSILRNFPKGSYVRSVGEVTIFCEYEHPPFVRDVCLALGRGTWGANPPTVVQITDIDVSVAKNDLTSIVSTYSDDWWNLSSTDMLPRGLLAVNLCDVDTLNRHFAQISFGGAKISQKRSAEDTVNPGTSPVVQDMQGSQPVEPLSSQDVAPPSKRVRYEASGSRKGKEPSDAHRLKRNPRMRVVSPPAELEIGQVLEIVEHLPMARSDSPFGSEFDENSSADLGERDDTDEEGDNGDYDV
ncbi:hypothetical protein BDN72DRAFT_901359 [Pluteus cervinus]|uniref:Uncharacterized protein n=1 Tax=Pluteus cervinus TaxID=181527 RepID=A0ACD3AG68_9AGAR|nr:hypothetical protein BDN72DRAFT_901359 [Pluteus cervinus]